MAVLGASLALGATGAALADKPQRIVSLNLCSDQILLDLVSRERIAALSFLALDPTMTLKADQARGIKTVRGSAEEVLALDPDLILAGEYSTPATVSLLERLGRRVVKVPMASTFEEIRKSVNVIAEAVGEQDRGHAVIAEFDKRISTASAPTGAWHPTVIAMQVNSLASGSGSLLDEAFTAAGFKNMARVADEKGMLGPAGRLPLETLLLDPPDLIVLANAPDDFRTVLGDNLRHPAFEKHLRTHPSLHLAMPLWLCGTPEIARVIEKLNAFRRTMSPDRRAP